MKCCCNFLKPERITKGKYYKIVIMSMFAPFRVLAYFHERHKGFFLDETALQIQRDVPFTGGVYRKSWFPP